MADSKTILSSAEEKMDMAIMYLEDALAHIRAGKADVRLLDGIRVDSNRGTRACSASSKKRLSTPTWVSCPKTTAKLSASASLH